MSKQSAWQAQWFRHAADVAETLTDAEILSLGRRLRQPIAYWLRVVADDSKTDVGVQLNIDDEANVAPAEWVMRLILEERNHTLKSVALTPRSRDDAVVESPGNVNDNNGT